MPVSNNYTNQMQSSLLALSPNVYYKQSFIKFIEPDFSKIIERRKHIDNLISIVTETANNRIFKLIERNHKRSVKQYFTENLEDIKANALGFKTDTPKEEELINKILGVQSPDELIETIKELECEIIMNLPSFVEVEDELKKLGPSAERLEIYNRAMSQYGRKMKELQKMLVAKTTSEDVKNAEELLKLFGVEETYLGNDPEQARALVNIIQKMYDRNDKIPNGIIVAPYTYSKNGELLSFDGANYMVINPLEFEKKEHAIIEKCREKALRDPLVRLIKPDEQVYARNEIKKNLAHHTSTNSIYHNIAHEAGHLQHEKGYGFKHYKLNKADLEIVKDLSNLAFNSEKASEICAEYYAKKILTNDLTVAEETHFNSLLDMVLD